MISKFERREIKYLIPNDKLDIIVNEIKKHVVGKDEKYTICNLYYDTDSYFLIRRSIEKPVYKEKLRIRAYGVPKDDDFMYLEIKKKFKKKVYKRRVKVECNDFDYTLSNLEESQISKEIQYFNNIYEGIKPKMFLSYDRVAFNNSEIRVSFDSNITYRDYELDLKKGIYGNKLLKDKVIMEVKINNSMPLWLSSILAENKLYKASYSKYGNAYTKQMEEKKCLNI